MNAFSEWMYNKLIGGEWNRSVFKTELFKPGLEHSAFRQLRLKPIWYYDIYIEKEQ